jgi:hypothetical protein
MANQNPQEINPQHIKRKLGTGADNKQQVNQPGADKAFQAPVGSKQNVMRSSDVSELLNKMNYGTSVEQTVSVLTLIELVTAKDGDLEKKSAILLKLTKDSEHLGILDDAVKTMITNEKAVAELLNRAISRDKDLTRYPDSIIKGYKRMNQQESLTDAKSFATSFGLDPMLLIAMKASGVKQGLEETREFRKNSNISLNTNVSFMYAVLNPPGTDQISYTQLDSEIRSFLA